MKAKMRIPRPLGFTLKAQYLNQLPEPKKQQEKDKLIQSIVDQYTNNGMMLNNRHVPIDQLASFLDIHPTKMLMLMNKSMERVTNFFDKGEDSKTLARGLFLRAIFWALENTSISKSQVHMLMANQGQNYVPFLTSEVNKAIANHTATLKPLTDMLKLFMEKSTQNPILNLTQNLTQNNQYVTPDEAFKLIESGPKSLLEDSESLKELGTQILPGLPDVNAKSQDLRAIGIRYDGSKKPDNPDLAQEAIEVKD